MTVEIREGDAWFDGRRVSDLATELGTPFFLFSERLLEENYHNFEKAFASHYPQLRIDYCVKANYEIPILRLLRSLGASAEISAAHELHIIETAGFHPGQAVYDSPYKSPQQIQYALERGIHAFYADSGAELNRIQEVAARLGHRARVALRANLVQSHPLGGLTEGFLRKFGMHQQEILSILGAPSRYPNLEFIGLSTHLGSQQISPAPFLPAIDRLVDLALLMEKKGWPVSEINLGGGFPSPNLYRITLPDLFLARIWRPLHRQPASIAEFGSSIGQRFRQRAGALQKLPVLALQPGRCIVGDSAIAVARVVAVKDHWIFLDISSMSLPESLFFARRRIIPAEGLHRPVSRRFHIAGRGLNTADNLGLNVPLPALQVGEAVILLDAGAYSLSRANRYTVLTPPAYLSESEGELQTIRREETVEDILIPMVF